MTLVERQYIVLRIKPGKYMKDIDETFPGIYKFKKIVFGDEKEREVFVTDILPVLKQRGFWG